MTVLENGIHVAAPVSVVWAALTRLDGLHDLDPGISASALVGTARSGIGAARRCEIRGGGWFCERITVWEPERALELTLYDCTLPVAKLRHHYALSPDGHGTRVDQVQEYTLRYGVLGTLLDALVVRRKWDAGVKAFLDGLKRHVEASREGAGEAILGSAP